MIVCMPQSGSIIGQISEELGELGKHVVGEAAKVPKDVAGKALESLGSTSGQKGQQSVGTGRGQDVRDSENTAVGKFTRAKDQHVKNAIARAALAQLAGVKAEQKEPTVWEKMQTEVEQKKEQTSQQQQQAANKQLPLVKSKRPRGDLFGVNAKQTSAERKGVRQD